MSQSQTIQIDVPSKLLPIFKAQKRFICLKGGRGSGKSHTVAKFLLIMGMKSPRRWLCCREIQKSISSSVHQLLSDIINKDDVLSQFYTITEKQIRGINGTLFIFAGLYQNETNVKSTEGIDGCWVEEGQSISRKSLDVLIPTVRNPGSFIIFSMNPTNIDDPVLVDYGIKEREDTLLIECNYYDNPFFPDVLRADMEYDRAHDPDKYAHIWLGKPVAHSEAQIFKGKWSIQEFEAQEKTFFYFGADWGFSQDPTTLIRCYVSDNTLYIDHEYYKIGLEITNINEAFNSIPESHNFPIFADSARPDTISYVRQHGHSGIIGAEKGKGSIEDGIEHIKGYKQIVIHPRCKHTIDEFRLYSYVTDKQTGLISNKIEDKNNHCIDALRYALNRLIKNKDTGGKIQMKGWG
jgi:phage terminase large subunit